MLLSGCSSIVVSENEYRSMVAYEPAKSMVHVDAGGTKVLISATHSMSPDVEKIWESWGNGEASIGNYKAAVAQVALDDLVKSGLFIGAANVTAQNASGEGTPGSASLLTSGIGSSAVAASGGPVQQPEGAGPADADIEVLIQTEESSLAGNFHLKVTLKIVGVATQETYREQTLEADLGDSIMHYTHDLQTTLQASLQKMKSDLAADFAGQNLGDLMIKAAQLDPSDLGHLLVARDRSMAIARERNRALVAAKTLTLPGLLQNDKTAELVDLTVKIEQVMLDLEHEVQMTKDEAQSEAASGNGSNLRREWALIYEERIDVLKPVLAAIKEEVANRGR
jgi:hypothetical protein